MSTFIGTACCGYGSTSVIDGGGSGGGTAAAIVSMVHVSGKIITTLSNGSIIETPYNSDVITEGSTNKFYTPARQLAIENAIGTVASDLDNEILNRVDTDTSLLGLITDETTARETHEADTTNPHNVTLEQGRSANNKLSGNVDMDSNKIVNHANPSASGDVVNKNYADQVLTDAKAYTDAQVTAIYRPAGDHDASTGLWPTTGTGTGGAIRRGDTYNVSVAGTLGGLFRDIGDTFYANVANPTTDAHWSRFEANVEQATEAARGTVRIAAAAEVADETSLEDSKAITVRKVWSNFWQRVLALAWTWAAKQTFSLAPRFSSTTGGQYLKVDGNKDLESVASIPAADVAESTTRRFASDAEKATWNAKQDTLTKSSAAEINIGTDASKYITSDQLNASKYLTQDGSKVSATASGTNAYTATITPAITSYITGQRFYIRFTNANTGAATINLNALGAKSIVKNGSSALISGDIQAGQVCCLSYDGTNFQLIGGVFPYTVDNLYETDIDIINAITSASYSPENNFKVNITPASSKIFFQGKMYDDGTFLYECVANNTVRRLGSEAPYVEYNAAATLPASGATVVVNGSGASAIELTLHTATVKGAAFYIRNIGTVGVKLLQSNASQKVYFRNASNVLQSSTTGTGGSVQLNEQWASLTIECVATNTFVITQLTGTLTFV